VCNETGLPHFRSRPSYSRFPLAMVCVQYAIRESNFQSTAEPRSKVAKGKQPANVDLPIRNTDSSGSGSQGPAGGPSNATGSTVALKSSRVTPDPFPYRLEVLDTPGPRRSNPVQIIFVHGLNGSKRETWSKSEFWPEWLHHEAGLQNVRIATFGYNSSSNVLAPNSNLSIPDFANQLLLYLSQLNYRDGSVSVPFYLYNSRLLLFSLHIVWVDWL
jgi:hypothetical protein